MNVVCFEWSVMNRSVLKGSLVGTLLKENHTPFDLPPKNKQTQNSRKNLSFSMPSVSWSHLYQKHWRCCWAIFSFLLHLLILRSDCRNPSGNKLTLVAVSKTIATKIECSDISTTVFLVLQIKLDAKCNFVSICLR